MSIIYQKIQMRQQQKPQGSWFSSTTTWMKKQYFNGTHYLDLLTNEETSQNIWLFGLGFPKRAEAKAVYSSVIWFTYREALEFPGTSISSDVGWGCMIRVGQMMLAQGMRIHKGPTFYQDEKYIQRLLEAFLERKGRFSIESLVKVGKNKLGKEPGTWYSPSQIALVLQQQFLKSEEDFKFLILHNQFDLGKVTKDLTNKKSQKLTLYPAIIVVLLRIGLSTCEKEFLISIVEILRHERSCIGILGGRPGRAHYIIGCSDKSFIYLDPHCVKAQKDVNTFFSETMFSLPFDKVDPSMGLCFYVKNHQQLVLLHQKLNPKNISLPIYVHSKEVPEIIDDLDLEDDEQFTVL